MTRRHDKLTEIISHAAADFFARESNHESLITVTRADLSPDLKHVAIHLSIMPESMEDRALAFAKRVRTDFREYLKERTRLHHLPTVDFTLDTGEKNRQRIDDLTRR